MLTQLLPSHGQRSWALNSLSLALLIYKRGLAGRLLTEMPRAQVECSTIILQHLGEWGELDTVGAKDLKGGGQVDHATAPCSWWAADRLTPWLCLFTACSAGPHRHARVPGYNSYKLRWEMQPRRGLARETIFGRLLILRKTPWRWIGLSYSLSARTWWEPLLW